MKRSTKVGTGNQCKKGISNNLARYIKKYQKHLQMQENIRFGRKARSISFVYATQDIKSLAKFILEGKK